jgi:small conductance mechanosensitive channel
MRVTKLETFDNKLLTVRNSNLAHAAVVNNVGTDRRRVSVDFDIGYDDDIDQARNTIIEKASHVYWALAEPEPRGPVTEVCDSAIVFSG